MSGMPSTETSAGLYHTPAAIRSAAIAAQTSGRQDPAHLCAETRPPELQGLTRCKNPFQPVSIAQRPDVSQDPITLGQPRAGYQQTKPTICPQQQPVTPLGNRPQGDEKLSAATPGEG
jgi:hypothetical protein